MRRFLRTTARKWPYLAGLLALGFIAYGVTVISQARTLQQRIAHELELLEDLAKLDDELHELGLIHRVDLSVRQYRWTAQYEQVEQHVAQLAADYPQVQGIPELPGKLVPTLLLADSLHREAMGAKGPWSESRSTGAVFQIMMQRAQKVVDRTARGIQERGLLTYTDTLSARWTEAQYLLVAACLMAVLIAWLAGVSNRLLHESRLRTEQLHAAKSKLEQTNRELRETMLSKEEKEVMIKEIHHRVKNNLQIVKSLIRFQQEQVQDPRTRELFNECITRVSAMALVHEQTYLTKDLANIPVDRYLDHLVRDLVHAYSVNKRLRMDIDIQVKTLSVDTLVPLGLLINEIISNAFKYAFTDREEGTIIVHLAGSETDGLHMRIGDDGVGLKSRDGFHRPNSLGMDLIHTLAGQLDADIHLLDGPGTQYELVSQRLSQKRVA